MSFIEDALSRYFEGKRRITAQASNRASQAGIECSRRLLWHRTKWEKAALPDEGLQRRFELGKILEPVLVRALEDSGLVVEQRQRDLSWPALQATGHLDGIVLEPETEKRRILEAKSVSVYVFQKVRKCVTAAELYRLGGYLGGYVSQGALYCLLMSLEEALLVFLDKASFQTHTITVSINDPFVLELAEAALKRWEKVNKAIKAGEDLPPEPGPYCEKCPFLSSCLPDQTFGQVNLLDDEELAGMISRRIELAPNVSEFEKLDDVLKERFDAAGETLVGDFLVRVKSHKKKRLRVPDEEREKYLTETTEYRRSYARVDKGLTAKVE